MPHAIHSSLHAPAFHAHSSHSLKRIGRLLMGTTSDEEEDDRKLSKAPLSPGSARRKVQHRSRSKSRSEEHTSELQSLMRISYAVFCLNKNKTTMHKRDI